MSARVAGKVALITGAARGMGRAFATRLAQEGADIVAVDLAAPLPGVAYDSATPADLADTAAIVQGIGRRIVTARCDVRDLDALSRVVDEAVAELGRLDIIVANAGICIPASWNDVTPTIFDDTMDINVRGVWNTVMAGVRHVVAADGGSIIMISSTAGLKAQPFLLPYTTSKWAVRGMAKAFAAELGTHRIRVNSVHPTGVRTGMGTGDIEAVIARAVEGAPRLGPMFTKMLEVDVIEPEDVAETILFLASDESKFVTGHNMAVDAGVSEY